MLSTIDSKLREPKWTDLQNASIEGAFRLENLLCADTQSAAFSAEVINEPGMHAVVRIWAAGDDNAADSQVAAWRRIKDLHHPNLIRILGTGDVNGGEGPLIYIAVEPADECLGTALKERALQPDEAVEILKNVVAALDYLHSNGYVHGAVSPDQIFAVGDDVKLSSENVRRADAEASIAGVPARYLAPESKLANSTTAADVWCMGAMLVECLTQKPPAPGIVEYPELSDPVRTIVRRSLDPDPESRCSLAEVIDLYSRKAAKLVKVEPEAPVSETKKLPNPEPVLQVVQPQATPTARVERPLASEPNPARRPSGVPLWAYGAGFALTLVILIWLLYPKPSARNSAQRRATPLPAAQQREIQPAAQTPASSETNSSERAQSHKPSPLKAPEAEKPPNSAAPAQSAKAPAVAASKNGSVWRVVVYAFTRREDAARKAEMINQKHAQLKAEAFSADRSSGPYLVVVGGSMTRDGAKRFRQEAVRAGMPRDSYFQNFNH